MSGRRNEPARARRREDLKKKLSLTSMKTGKSENEFKLNLANHFGWQVLGKTQVGDRQFPHVSQYFEKPEIAGRDFEKVTYVLYMDCKDMDAMPKTTSSTTPKTASSTHKVKEVPSREREEKLIKPLTPKASKKLKSRSRSKHRYLISDLQYPHRRKSNSPKREKSKDKYSTKSGDSGHELKETKSVNINLSEVRFTEDEREKYIDELCKAREAKRKTARKRSKSEKREAKEKAKKEVEKHRKKGHDSWALRAGADSTKSNILIENKEETVKIKSYSVIKKGLKLLKLFNLNSDPKRTSTELSTECLFPSPSGTNKYLFVARSSSKHIGAKYKMKTTNYSGSNISS